MTLAALAALALGGTPALAQAHAHGQASAGEGHEGGMTAMVCTMGMLPHTGGMSEGMQQGGMMGGMQQRGAMMGMQHGATTGGMQHGAATGSMQHGAAGQAAAAEGAAGMDHPVTPTMLIHHAQDLGLTEPQQAKLGELAKSSQAACEQHLKQAVDSHRTAASLLGAAAPDVAGYQARLGEASDHLIEAHVAVVKAGIEARAMLTPAQREKLAATAHAMHAVEKK
jgi:uncharacterized membrane protein